MQEPNHSKNKLLELQNILSKMPLEVITVAALPDLGVRWREVSRAVRNARMPMQPASIAKVLCKHFSKALSVDEITDIVGLMRLKLVATQSHTWHVINLLEKTIEEPVTVTTRAAPGRIVRALKKSKRIMRPEVQTFLHGDFMYLSIQLVSENKEGSVLYVCAPLGEPVVLVSSANMVGLLKATVEGLGYKNYENANLSGRDVKSLLRINDRNFNENAENLAGIPEYNPIPVVTSTGIDYTNKIYDEKYVDNMLGPDPPVLTELTINTNKPFFDRALLDKNINLSVTIKSDNVAQTLKNWVSKGALAPTSDLFKIFHVMKSNKISYNREESDDSDMN